jgi:hypothetical protein
MLRRVSLRLLDERREEFVQVADLHPPEIRVQAVVVKGFIVRTALDDLSIAQQMLSIWLIRWLVKNSIPNCCILS